MQRPFLKHALKGGNPVLHWSGITVGAGFITHVGFEMAGSTSPTILSMSWLSGTGVLTTRPIQINYHMWGNGHSLTLNNDFVGNAVIANGGTVEWHLKPVPLDQMLPNINRNPIRVDPLPTQPTPIQPGCPMRMPLPTAPPTAHYALFVVNLFDAQGQPATMDFVQLPLDMEMRPVIEPGGIMGSFFDINFDLLPGRIYRVRESPTLEAGSFFDVFTELSLEEGGSMNFMLPMNGPTKFYQLGLDPE